MVWETILPIILNENMIGNESQAYLSSLNQSGRLIEVINQTSSACISFRVNDVIKDKRNDQFTIEGRVCFND